MKFLAGALAAARFASADITAVEELTSGLDLQQPVELHSTGGQLHVELDYTTCDYTGPFTAYRTRCYAYDGVPMIPGPTLFIYPGDLLTIKLTNKLSSDDDVHYHNFWQHLNYTNLHFHGAHISADVPADDVLTMIPSVTEDGEETSITYVYKLEDYHMPGTAWYHPHGHGSATLQTGTGSAGMIIIKDTEIDVPSYIRDAPEINMMITHVPINHIRSFGMQTCINSQIMTPTTSGPEGNLPLGPLPLGSAEYAVGEEGIVTVNGMTNPVLTVNQGEWTRLRHVMASPLYMINGEGSTNDEDVLENCQFRLLAKDSIYIDDPLRVISKIYLYPGGRADVMMKCDIPGLIQFDSVYFAGQEAITHHVPNFIGHVFQINVVGSSSIDVDLPDFTVQRPCYLADTASVLGDEDWVTKKYIIYDSCGESDHRRLSASSDGGAYEWEYDSYSGSALVLEAGGIMEALGTCEAMADNSFGAKTGIYCINGCSFELGYQFPILTDGSYSDLMTPAGNEAVEEAAEHINQWEGDVCGLAIVDNALEIGDIIEWDVWGIDYHPVHFHVHPYKLVEMDYELGNQAGDEFDEEGFHELTGNFYHVGDYGDSMMIPVKHAKFHQQLANFNGVMINHCHILMHEDFGMMTAYIIGGDEYTITRAQEIDTTCYWTAEEHTGYTITGTCSVDSDCPTGWSCPHTHRRALKFGSSGEVCVEN